MATAMFVTDASPTDRRREIEEWHSSLATRTDAEILQIPTGATPASAAPAPVSPSLPDTAPRRGLMSRLFLVTR